MALKIVSINARGISSPTKLDLFLHELARLNYDVYLLQETHVSNKQCADTIAARWGGNCFWSFGIGKSAGVALFTSPSFTGRVSRFQHDNDGRIFSALVLFNSLLFNIVNIYAPNTVSERKIFFDHLHDYFFSQGDLIIGGDFNCIDAPLDRLHVRAGFNFPDKNTLHTLMGDFGLVDVWRKRNPRGVAFTWSNIGQASRIDRFFISKFLLQRVRSNTIFPCTLSDHDFTDLELLSPNVPNNRSGVWKFNATLLSDPDFVLMMSDMIKRQKCRIENFDTLGAWWEYLKSEIKRSCVGYCARKRTLANRERNTLNKRIICLKNRFHSGDQSVLRELKESQSTLSSLIQKEAEGAKIRARAQWIEEGEKPTRYFFRLERKRAEANTFTSLFDANGVEKFAPSDIENILVDFYKSLFSKDHLDMQIQTKLIDDLELSLTDHERDSCEGLFSREELFSALQGLQTGKSPGSDGLPPEFYLAFFEDLNEPLLNVLNECFHAGVLTDSQRESHLRLTFKKDDKRQAKNWRPISLLNADYKVASKIITERLKLVMGSIVHQDQTCGVVGRTIFSNLQLVRDTLDMINKTNETGILLSLDQEKAFDRVDHAFLIRTLTKFGFGPSFCQWVGIFYCNVFSRIIINGNLSRPVFLGRGVRQGCPLSPLLYVLISEVLSTQIRKCKGIEGFLLPGAGGLQFKISQYADDALNFLKSERSVRQLLSVVRDYEKGSGAKLNTSKSQMMWLGRWRAYTASPFGFKLVSKMRILGVFFSNGLVSVDDDNWRSKLVKLEKALNLWSQRDLSFIGRAMIVNVLGASRFWHVAKILSPPHWFYSRYNSIVWPFIWKGKMENVSRQRCCAPLSRGGLNIVDFRTKCICLRLSNFRSFRDRFGTEKWHYLARYFLGKSLFLLDNRFTFPSNLAPSSAEPTRFYKACLTCFRDLRDKFDSVPDELSCKTLYSLLLELPRVAPGSAGFWESGLSRPTSWWASVWRKSRLKLIENHKNDLMWQVIHRVVRVRANLKKWGYIGTDQCALCLRVETIEHCFLECPRARVVWKLFNPILSRFFPTPLIFSPSSVFFPLSDTPTHAIASYLLTTILYWIWNARNLATFRNSIISAKKIADLITRDVHLRIRCEPPDAVKYLWSHKGILCSIDAQHKITFHL